MEWSFKIRVFVCALDTFAPPNAGPSTFIYAYYPDGTNPTYTVPDWTQTQTAGPATCAYATTFSLSSADAVLSLA